MFYGVSFIKVAFYLCKSTILPFMEYCCHIWAGAPNCYLDMLGKLQKQVFRTLGSSSKFGNLSLYYMHYFGRCLSETAKLVPLSYYFGGFTCLSVGCMIFLPTLLDVHSSIVKDCQWQKFLSSHG